ncbi:type II toxin-antitoxin system VapB family antitoxin [Nocardia arthritidis]|uniref:Type II toxin-antitoxin system VapB family antitoxin n=2 Tax=Nocardia arthritidis TaxID=228602 RepID=A0A6G9YKH9_9NOCA|nr:type II toxin-antitoxin system VapB family antitoxin [Nocardia arthritidis]
MQMAVTSINIDDDLIAMAQRLSGLGTKREVVDVALREFVQRMKQRQLADRIAGGRLTPTPELLDPSVREAARK